MRSHFLDMWIDLIVDYEYVLHAGPHGNYPITSIMIDASTLWIVHVRCTSAWCLARLVESIPGSSIVVALVLLGYASLTVHRPESVSLPCIVWCFSVVALIVASIIFVSLAHPSYS